MILPQYIYIFKDFKKKDTFGSLFNKKGQFSVVLEKEIVKNIPL